MLACILQGAPALLTHTAFGAPTGVPTTSSAINTTGATLLIATIEQYNLDPNTATVIDSNGNTWVHATSYTNPGGEANVGIWYAWQSLVTGAGHTVTVTGSAAGVVFAAFSGTQTSSSPVDQQNGSVISTGVTLQPQAFGSITPSVSGTLVIAVAGLTSTTSSPYTPTGATLVDSVIFNAPGNEGNGTAYAVQTSPAAFNPTWTWGGTASPETGGLNISFKPAAGSPSTRASQGFTF